MLILGITGAIATGKTTTAKSISALSQPKAPIFIADDIVHQAFFDPKIIKEIADLQQDLVIDGKIDRIKLSNIAFSDPQILVKLQDLLHPIVKHKLNIFLHDNFLSKQKLVILDIPLLFESDIDIICDYIMLVKSNLIIQKERYLYRNNSSVEKFNKILAIADKNCVKDNRIDFTIDTGLEKSQNQQKLQKIINYIIENARNSARYRDYRSECRKW